MALPITPVVNPRADSKLRNSNARQGDIGDNAGQAAVKFAAKLVGLVAVVLVQNSRDLPRLILETCYVFGLYFFMGVITQGVGFFTVLLLDLRVAPHFDSPFLSSSLSDFWSRRWNLNTCYTLRFMVYDPIVQGHLHAAPPPSAAAGLPPPSRARRFAATCAAFVASGIMHEVFIIYFRGQVSWYWLAFFSVQGPLVCAESLLRGWARRRGVAVPRAAAAAATLAALLGMADALLFPPVTRLGLADRVVANMYSAVVQVAPPGLGLLD